MGLTWPNAGKKGRKGDRRFLCIYAFNTLFWRAGEQKAILTGFDRTRTAFTYFKIELQARRQGVRGGVMPPSPKSQDVEKVNKIA